MDDLPTAVRDVLRANQSTLAEMHAHATEDSDGDAPSVTETLNEEYEGYDVDIEVRVRYTGEPHRYDVRKGHFSIDIRATLEDTAILTDVKPFFYDVHDALLPAIESVVRQDYPTGTLKISEDVKIDEFEEWFVNA